LKFVFIVSSQTTLAGVAALSLSFPSPHATKKVVATVRAATRKDRELRPKDGFFVGMNLSP
jgi:hypothetical protein